MYIYGTFDANTSKTLLISKPLQVELKFELPSSDLKKQLPISSNINITPSKQVSEDIVYSKVEDEVKPRKNSEMIETTIAKLLSEESEIEMNNEQEEISMYAQKIISTIENAWMKPRNIPEGLVANLRLRIRSSGRITSAELLKSSGNIRFDNSALQAVRRVETFHFFDSIPKTLYDKEFKVIAISFNPS
jgi:TolA protein